MEIQLLQETSRKQRIVCNVFYEEGAEMAPSFFCLIDNLLQIIITLALLLSKILK